MLDFLDLKPQDIDSVEKHGKLKACIVGCGQTGVLYVFAFAEAGFNVICTDADQSLLKRLAQGKTSFSERELELTLRRYIRAGTLKTTNDLKSAVSQSDIIVLANSVEIDNKRNSNLSVVKNICKQVGSTMQRGALVINAGMVSLGFTETVLREMLENTSGFKVGSGFGLVYVNSQITEQEKLTELIGNLELTVGADDKASLDAASLVLSTITKRGIRQATSTKIAELATLFTYTKRYISTALANELATLCESARIDYYEALKAMNLGLQESEFAPTLSIGEGNETGTYLLLDAVENLGVKLRLAELALKINEGMVRYAVNLTQKTLRDCGKTLRRARIAILGASGPRTLGEAFVKMLMAKGTRINVYDPNVAKSERSDFGRVLKTSLIEAVESCDCVVILTAEEQFRRLNLKSLRSVMKTPVIVDLAAIFEPLMVESKGFIYRGLGRGFGEE